MPISRHPLTPSAQDLGKIPVDRAVVALLAASFANIQARGAEFADRFYAKLFAAHPGVRAMFPQDMTAQKEKLLLSLQAVVAHLSDPGANLRRLQDLGKRHVSYGARPEHYPLVVAAMIEAMRDVAGPEWNPAIEQEWRRALTLVSEVMMRASSATK